MTARQAAANLYAVVSCCLAIIDGAVTRRLAATAMNSETSSASVRVVRTPISDRQDSIRCAVPYCDPLTPRFLTSFTFGLPNTGLIIYCYGLSQV